MSKYSISARVDLPLGLICSVTLAITALSIASFPPLFLFLATRARYCVPSISATSDQQHELTDGVANQSQATHVDVFVFVGVKTLGSTSPSLSTSSDESDEMIIGLAIFRQIRTGFQQIHFLHAPRIALLRMRTHKCTHNSNDVILGAEDLSSKHQRSG